MSTGARRVMPLLGLVATLVLLVRMQHSPTVGSDAWLHLRLGDEFRSGWSIRHPGHLGVFDTGVWYPTQWLSQIAMSWMQDTAGLPGVVWMTGTFILALPVFMYVACRRLVAPLPAALATVMGTCAAAPGLSARPQVVSYLLILMFVSVWLSTARDLKPRYWLVAVVWIWVPIHGMWMIGISIGLAAVAGIALTRPGSGVVLRLASIPLLSGVAALLTPLGFHSYDAVSGVSDRSSELTEWMPPDFTAPNALVLASMIAIVLVVALRGGPVDWPTVLILGLGICWALFSVRTTIVAAVMLTPLLAEALQRVVPQDSPIRRPELVLVLSMLATASAGLWLVAFHRDDAPPVPPWVDQRLDTMPEGSRVLNDWTLGHYIVWRHPDLQVVMHGYVDVFSVDELRRNIDIARVEPGWDSEVAGLDVDYAMVDPDTPLGYALSHQLGWETVQGDDSYVLLRPPSD